MRVSSSSSVDKRGKGVHTGADVLPWATHLRSHSYRDPTDLDHRLAVASGRVLYTIEYATINRSVIVTVLSHDSRTPNVIGLYIYSKRRSTITPKKKKTCCRSAAKYLCDNHKNKSWENILTCGNRSRQCVKTFSITVSRHPVNKINN